jgi:hypothetical protein
MKNNLQNKVNNLRFLIEEKCGVANTEIPEWVINESLNLGQAYKSLKQLNKMATKIAKDIKVFKDEDGWYHTYDTNNNVEGFCHHWADEAQYFEALERVYFKYFYKTIV